MNSDRFNAEKKRQAGFWHIVLRRITILFSVLTILSALFYLFSRINIPGLNPLLLGITIFLFGIKEYDLYFKCGRNKSHLHLAIIYTIIFIFDLISALSQLQAAFLPIV